MTTNGEHANFTQKSDSTTHYINKTEMSCMITHLLSNMDSLRLIDSVT